MSEKKLTVREKIALFPHQPGVYRYYDSDGNVIYVGKAKDLHKRVAQYFVPPERLTRKTAIMVSKIADAQYSDPLPGLPVHGNRGGRPAA